MELYVNPTITDFRQDVNGDIKMLKIGVNKEDAYANIIGQAEGADLDNNKTKTINVSTYTEPVEVLPTAGKDGMKKATITLSNIPESGATLYRWQTSDSGALTNIYLPFSVAPESITDIYGLFINADFAPVIGLSKTLLTTVFKSYEKVSDTSFTAVDAGNNEHAYTFTNVSIALW